MNINTTTEYININNFRQNIMTISSDDSNPVLLIVHGGAGSPDRPLVKKYNSELAEYYTVVCWDQRGSGLSYTKEDLTIDIILNDLKSVVEFLRNRYNQDKIYIAGHSWGAYLGLRFSFMHPEYVKYYIGTGQGISSFADEILVVDSYSTDKTEQICKEMGVTFVQHKFEDYGKQKQYAIEKAKYDMILSIDADEFLSKSLIDEILFLKNKSEYFIK